jgi:hypothetical protein
MVVGAAGKGGMVGGIGGMGMGITGGTPGVAMNLQKEAARKNSRLVN